MSVMLMPHLSFGLHDMYAVLIDEIHAFCAEHISIISRMTR